MHDFILLVFDLLQRGIILAVAAAFLCALVLLVVFVICRKKAIAFPWKKAILILLLIGYIAILLYATVLRYGNGHRQINLYLFRAWREAWNQYSLQGWLNVILNIILFVPLGVILPLLTKKFQSWYSSLIIGFCISLAIELIQFFSGRGIFDVDDLFTNTLGCLLGSCFVMFFLFCFDRKRKCPKKGFAYASVPLLFAASLCVIFLIYHVQTYGNLAESPTYTADTKKIEWTINIDLEDTVSTAPIYQTTPFDKASCDIFGADFARKIGITFPNIYYYDSLTLFANHSTGDFLNVSYPDRSYEYSHHTNSDAIESDEKTVRNALRKYGLELPEDAIFQYEGKGVHSFTIDMVPFDDVILNGTLTCRYLEDGSFAEINNNIISFQFYQDERILSRTEAVQKLQAGKFYGGNIIEYYSPEKIYVQSCVLEYRIDSKGFSQPVYVFQLDDGGGFIGTAIVPAMR